MGRIRTIKPDFFTDEELFDLEKESGLPIRVAFSGLWTQADREGRLKWRPRKLKTQILPYDDVDFSRVLDALRTRGFIVKYRDDNGNLYGWIPSFKEHQYINNKEQNSILPDPENCFIEDGLTREPREGDALKSRGVKEGKEVKIGREGKSLKDITREKTENLESLNLPPNPIPPPALVGNPFVESYSAPVWLRKVFGELYEEATGQLVICSGIEVAKAKEFFAVLSKLHPDADDREIFERAKLGAEIAFEGYTEGTGFFHWLDKSPPTVGWFANNAPQVNLAVTARLNMTEEEIEQERETREAYERIKAFADEVDAQVEKDLAEGRKPLSRGLGLPKPRTEH